MDPLFSVSGPLWDEAKRLFYADVGEIKGGEMTDTATLSQTVECLKIASVKASKEYGEHSFRKDKKPAITIKLGRIMKRLEVLMKIGDSYIKSAPETVSLVWMAFRMIFTGFLEDAASCEFLTDAVDQITDIIFICSVFEKRYLTMENEIDTAKAMKDRILAQIPPLYAEILKFQFQSRKLFKHGKLARSLIQWRSKELDETLSNAQQKRGTLQDTAGIGFQDAALDALQGIQFDMSIIRDVSKTIQNEVVPGIKNIQAEQTQTKERHNVEDIQKRFKTQSEWLRTGPIAGISAPGRVQNTNKDRIHPGSADWVLESNTFETWRDAPRGGLAWLWGNGGFGKSFLISAMIEHLENIWPMTNPHVVYFFCKKGEDAYSMGKRVFIHLLVQLYEKAADGNPGSSIDLQDKLSKLVEAVWKQSKSVDKHDSTLVPMSTWLQLFKELAKALATDIFVLVDGLDECEDAAEEFISCLLELSKEDNLHMMMSSRPDTYLGVPHIPLNIQVTSVQTREPILEVVKSRIKGIGWLRGPERKKERMRACKRISEKSDGSFRYAEVVLEGLSKPQSTPFSVLLRNLPNGMNDLYRQSMASLDPHLRNLLIVALRWLMCSSGQVAINLIAEELEGRWENAVEDDQADDHGIDDDDDDLDDYTDSESESESESEFEASGAVTRRAPESTQFSCDVAKELRIAGRDFLVFDGDCIDTQHNSIRDFILEEEERIKYEVEHCAECKSRLQATIAFEAGPKEGNFIICRTILKRLNNPAFQREHIIKDKVILRHGPHRNTIPPSGDRSATDNASIQEMPEKDSPDTLHKAPETLSDGPNDQVKEVAHVSSHVVDGPSDVFHSPMAIPEVLDEHIVPSKEDILKYLKEEDESKTVADVQDHPEETVLPHTPQSTDGQITDQDLSESDWSAGESMRSERYELLHWPEHFKQLERITDDETKQSERWNTLYADLETFLQRDSEAYQWWLRRWAPWREFENFESPHLIAAGCGLLELLKRQLSSNKYDLNERNDDNDTALLLACGKEGHCCVRFLIELGADVNATNNAGATPLLHLIRHRGSMDDFNALLKAGAKADIADNNGVTPLHLAAENSNLEMCKALLKVKGVNANAKDKIYGETALHVSFKRSDPSAELLELLIANGADVNEQDNDSQGALYEACSVGDANSAAVLLRLGADINDDEDVFGHTALHAAIAVKSLPTVKVLIDAGADLTLRDKSGQSALHQSIVVGQFQIFECIIEALIANDLLQQQILQHETLDAFTPLHCACHHGDFDMTNRLLEIGNASQMVSEKDRRGDLALHLAAENSFTAIVLLLLNAGSDPKEKNISALTPIDLAVLTWTHGPMDEPPTENMVLTVLALIGKADVAQQHELVLMDIEAEAMTPICFEYKHLRDMPDEHGWTPLALARQLRRPRKVKMLLDGAEGDYEPKIVGERPTKLYRLSRPSYQGRDVDFTGSEDELEVRTFKEDLSFDPEYDLQTNPPGLELSVTANHPAPAGMPCYYFEVEICAVPQRFQLVIGFMDQNKSRTGRHVHAWKTDYDGNTHTERKPYEALISNQRKVYPLPEEYAVGFKGGDVVGCGYDLKHEIVFFTINGKRLAPAIFRVRGRLFPAVRIFDYDIRVRFNFGNDPARPFKCTTWADSTADYDELQQSSSGALYSVQTDEELDEEIQDPVISDNGYLKVPKYGNLPEIDS